MSQGSIQKLEQARGHVLSVYQSEVTDDYPDNGNLTTLNNIITGINRAIHTIETRNL